MVWGNSSASRAARRNARIRGGGTWGDQGRRLSRFQQHKYRRESAGGGWDNTTESLEVQRNRRLRGRGTWGDQGRRLSRHKRKMGRQEMGGDTWSAQARRMDRTRRHRDREQRKSRRSAALQHHGRLVAFAALVLGAVLLLSGGTRGAGLMMLVLAGLALYVITGHKRA
jgi:hypothetical protein